jgi:hypothetical protein
MHEKTAMTDLRYAIDARGRDHPLLGRAPRGLRVSTGNGGVEVSRVARAGRGLLLVLSDAGRQAAHVAESWRDRVDVVCASAAPAADGTHDPTEADALAALLLRPDGHVVWVGANDGCDHPSAVGEALEQVFGPPAAACREPNEATAHRRSR